jgi:hypothetical protein
MMIDKRSSVFMSLLLMVLLTLACTVDQKQSGVPAEMQATIDTVTADVAFRRFEKIYKEAAEEWRRKVTLEQSSQFFSTLKEKLGAVKSRESLTGKRKETAGGDLPGNSFVMRYNTQFERGDGLETFTLVERDGRWLLAGYSVSSNLLQ